MSLVRAIVPSRPARLAGLALAACILAPAAHADAPDLVALSVNGSPTAEIGASAFVNVFVVNLGGPLSGAFTLDVVLSADDVIDDGDAIVGSTETTLPGAHAIPVTIPGSLTPGTMRWALRVSAAEGEENTFNNAILGGEVELFVIDLCVADPSPIAASSTNGGAAPASRVLAVSNCGSANGLLIFTVTAVPPVPWLTISPTASFALAGNGSQPVTVSFDPGAATIGTHSTNIVVQNFRNPADLEVIPVSFTLGEASFTPGDRMVGAVDLPGELDDAVFTGVAGMRLKVKFTRTSGNLAPVLRLLDAQQQEVAALTLKKSNKTISKSLALPATGTYRLRIEGAGGSVGGYLLETGRKLPKAAKKQKVGLKPGKESLTVLALAGATLDLTIAPKKGQPDVALALMLPQGQHVDLSASTQEMADGGVEARGIVLEEAGAYTITVLGLEPGTKVKAHVGIQQPALGDDVVLLP